VATLLVSLALVFLAEFGDKTQILTLALAARYGVAPVLTGVAVATAGMNVLSVAVGAGLARAVPTRALSLAAGLLFLAFAVWTGRGGNHQPPADGQRSFSIVAARSAGIFAVSEVGDKTMLATIALAAHGPAVLVWAGATLGIMAAEALAVLAGAALGRRLPERLIRIGAALVFAGVGVVFISRALVG
jgi:putative Ca2+/H+ antiporter (TMEM165/GDT1 family)